MRLAWGIGRLIALAGIAAVIDPPAQPDACSAAFDRRAWELAAGLCGGPADHDRIQQAWALTYLGRHDDVLAITASLVDSRQRADARYLRGRLLARLDDGREGQRLLWEALGLHAIEGNRRGVNAVSCDLVRAANEDGRFEAALVLARLCDRTARSVERRRFAKIAAADAYDLTGYAAEATQMLFDCAELAADVPVDLAWCLTKHGQVLLDRRTAAANDDALAYLDEAAASLRRGKPDAVLEVSIQLNRAVALAQLDRDGDAQAALDAALQRDPGSAEHPIYTYVRGVLAVHRGETAEAERLLQQAVDDGIPPDYAIDAHVELAGIHRRAHRDADAERLLIAAIALVEDRRRGGDLERRPWILAHRATPYHDLIALLAEAGRAADALAVMEALHARSWLDARADPGAEPIAAPPPAALLALAGDREVLVLVDAGATLWRAHVLGGEVRIDAIDGGGAALAALEHAPDDPAIAERAGRAVIPDRVVASDRPLHLVASGRLAAVPFAALRRGGRTLVDDRPIARLPGLVALGCRRRAPGGPAVVLGDARGDLPAAALEARAVARRFGVAASVGPAATTAAVIGARDAELLHVAVHATVSGAGGAIELADDVIDAAAIRAHAIAPRLVVLAGCQTSGSRDAETWGALPSAFLAAGADLVVATTRSVDDGDAGAFVHAFYARPEVDPIRRLAAAQRELARTLPASAWASFAAWGTDCEATVTERP